MRNMPGPRPAGLIPGGCGVVLVADGARAFRRAVVAVALIGGLLGAVALGALAGARRTASAYGRYLASINASDVFVDIPGPVPAGVAKIAKLHTVRESAAWVGLAANPVIHGRVDDSFLGDNLVGSYNGDYFRQDRMTVAGRQVSRGWIRPSEIALNQPMAKELGVGVGGESDLAVRPAACPRAGYPRPGGLRSR